MRHCRVVGVCKLFPNDVGRLSAVRRNWTTRVLWMLVAFRNSYAIVRIRWIFGVFRVHKTGFDLIAAMYVNRRLCVHAMLGIEFGVHAVM